MPGNTLRDGAASEEYFDLMDQLHGQGWRLQYGGSKNMDGTVMADLEAPDALQAMTEDELRDTLQLGREDGTLEPGFTIARGEESQRLYLAYLGPYSQKVTSTLAALIGLTEARPIDEQPTPQAS